MNQAVKDLKPPSWPIKYGNNAMNSCAYIRNKDTAKLEAQSKERRHVQKGTFCVKDAVE